MSENTILDLSKKDKIEQKELLRVVYGLSQSQVEIFLILIEKKNWICIEGLVYLIYPGETDKPANTHPLQQPD